MDTGGAMAQRLALSTPNTIVFRLFGSSATVHMVFSIIIELDIN